MDFLPSVEELAQSQRPSTWSLGIIQPFTPLPIPCGHSGPLSCVPVRGGLILHSFSPNSQDKAHLLIDMKQISEHGREETHDLDGWAFALSILKSLCPCRTPPGSSCPSEGERWKKPFEHQVLDILHLDKPALLCPLELPGLIDNRENYSQFHFHIPLFKAAQ